MIWIEKINAFLFIANTNSISYSLPYKSYSLIFCTIRHSYNTGVVKILKPVKKKKIKREIKILQN